MNNNLTPRKLRSYKFEAICQFDNSIAVCSALADREHTKLLYIHTHQFSELYYTLFATLIREVEWREKAGNTHSQSLPRIHSARLPHPPTDRERGRQKGRESYFSLMVKERDFISRPWLMCSSDTAVDA